MRKAYFLLALAVSAVSAFAASVNTGSEAWVCVSGPQGCSAGGTPVVNLGVSPNNVWTSATGGSQWVSTTAGSGTLVPDPGPGWMPGGTYVYELTLAAPLSNGNYSFQFAADNGGIVDLVTAQNGVLQTPLPYNVTNGTGYSPGVSASGSFAGTVTKIRVTVFNDTLPAGGAGGPSPSGFFLSGNINDVPEPSTWAMFGLGAAAIAFARLRRKA